jgi:hypothetical protein
MKTKAKRASNNGIPLEKIAANGTNGTNGHAKMHPLEEMMQDVPPEARVERFMEMWQQQAAQVYTDYAPKKGEAPKTKKGESQQANSHAKPRLAENNLLDTLLSGLTHEQRVEALGVMAHFIKDGKLTAESATSIVDEIRTRAQTHTLIPKKEEPPPSAPPFDHRSNGEGTVAAANGHDPKTGRFTTGNQCAARRSLNAHARKQASLRAIIAEEVDEECLRQIVRRLAVEAKRGFLDATKLLFSYLLGRPGPAPDPGLLDLREWELIDAHPTKFEFVRALIDGVDPAIAAKLLLAHPKSEDEVLEKGYGAKSNLPEVIQARDKRSGRKRKPSNPLRGCVSGDRLL